MKTVAGEYILGVTRPNGECFQNLVSNPETLKLYVNSLDVGKHKCKHKDQIFPFSNAYTYMYACICTAIHVSDNKIPLKYHTSRRILPQVKKFNQ